MNRLSVAVLAAGVTLGSLLLSPASAAEAEPGAALSKMDAAVRAEAGLARAAHGRGRVAPLRRDADGRTVVYVEGETAAALKRAVTSVDGLVSDVGTHRVRAAVPPRRLAALAAQPGVVEVRRPETPVPMEVVSEGLQPSGALAWHGDGKQGAGVKVGILDVGFGRLDAAQEAGELPADVAVFNGQCGPEHSSSHGTTMAEVVHDVAPQAQLYLACVTDSMDLDDAARWLKDQGVTVVSISMGFPGTGRGNGLSDTTELDWTPATVVAWLRGQGIVVVAAAGNEAANHMTGPTTDSDNDLWMEISGPSEGQAFTIAAGATVTVELKWDAWPKTNHDLELFVMDHLPKPTGPNDPHLGGRFSTRAQKETAGGLSPTETVTFTNTASDTTTFWAYVQRKDGTATNLRYDLTIYGNINGLSYVEAAGSIAEPASSPYAIAVGAITPADASTGGTVERYSSRGPTIDGRMKPDVTGFTNVSTFTGGVAPSPTKAGTSIAAAHVAGAAALYKSAAPDLDPAELEGLLLDSSARPGRNNDLGHGILNLGSPRIPQAPVGSAFTPWPASRRLLDTTTTTGGHNGPLTAGETVSLPIPNLPPDATSVALNVTATSATAPTDIEVFADKSVDVRTLAASPSHVDSVMVLAAVHPQDKVVRFRNSAGNTHLTVDTTGFFSTSSSANTYVPTQSPIRLQTPSPSLAPGAANARTVPIRGVSGIPANATAVMVSVTASQATAPTHVKVYAKDWPNAWTFNPYPGETAAYSYLVPIGDDGAIRIGHTVGSVQVSVDVVGWFGPGVGARFVPLMYPTPLFSSATGVGTSMKPFAARETRSLKVTAWPRIPFDATGAVLALSAPRADTRAQMAVWPEDYQWSGAPSLGVEATGPKAGPGWSVEHNALVTPLGASGALRLRSYAGTTDAAVVVNGYLVGGQSVARALRPDSDHRWTFDEGSGTVVADSSGDRPATMRGSASWNTGISNQAGWFASGGYAETSASAVRSDQSFTIAAWAYLADKSTYRTVLAQDGNLVSAFTLEYYRAEDRWAFIGRVTDGNSPASTIVRAHLPVRLHTWTHLVGAYDAGTRQMRLYVDGVLAGQASHAMLASNGRFTIGRDKLNGASRVSAPAGVDDVRTYNLVLPESDIRDLYASYDSPPIIPISGASISCDTYAENVGLNIRGDNRLLAWPNNRAYPAWPWQAEVAIGVGFSDPTKVKFADLNGDGCAELIGVNIYGTNVIHAWFNTGSFPADPWADPPIVIGSGWSDGTRVQFADLTGDGRAELIGVSANNDGRMLVWRNVGAFPAWTWDSQVAVGTGWTNPNWAKFADLTGDGRAEAIGVHINNNGHILADQNTGAFPNWPWGARPSVGTGWTDAAKAKFGDLNGDGYAELQDVNLGGDGFVFARTNIGGYPAIPWATPRTRVGSGVFDPLRLTYG